MKSLETKYGPPPYGVEDLDGGLRSALDEIFQGAYMRELSDPRLGFQGIDISSDVRRLVVPMTKRLRASAAMRSGAAIGARQMTRTMTKEEEIGSISNAMAVAVASELQIPLEEAVSLVSEASAEAAAYIEEAWNDLSQ